MAAYHYRAINANGKEKKGIIESDTEKTARQQLRAQGLFPTQIYKVRDKKKKGNNLKGRFAFLHRAAKLSAKELALVTRQFSTLLSAGLPIEESLQAVAEQTEKAATKGIVLSVRSKVVEGHSLASAMEEHPEAFSALFCATVSAGEKSGHLDKVLARLADYTEQQWQMKQKIKTAMIYPAMIILVAVGIVGFLLEYVVPKMITVYGRLHQELPVATTILINISEFIKKDGLYLLLILIIGIFLWRQLLHRYAQVREKTHRFLLQLPLIGNAIKTIDTARFSRTLAILSASGVPMIEAMNISTQLISNIPIRLSVNHAVLKVREGASIYLALKQTGYFSPMSIHMIASGEASGQLENMLERIATLQESEILRLIDVGLALFEPAIILIMGAVVLFIVLAVLLPIFSLNEFMG